MLESELAGLLRRKGESVLPSAIWSSLYSALKVFLRVINTGDNMVCLSPFPAIYKSPYPDLKRKKQFFFFFQLQLVHSDTVSAVKARYAPSYETVSDLHQSLARFFLKQLDMPRYKTHPEEVSTRANTRAVSEATYHLYHAGMWTELVDLLTDLQFVEVRCRCKMIHELLLDYTRIQETKFIERNKQVDLAKIRAFQSFVLVNFDTLNKIPGLTLQQALNQPAGNPLKLAAGVHPFFCHFSLPRHSHPSHGLL